MSTLKIWPHPVPAVRVLVFNEQGQLLLLKRTNTEYGDGQWCLPGGKIDYLGSPESAAINEVHEETGLHLVNLEFLFYQNNLPSRPGLMHCINFYFKGSGQGTVCLNDESSAFVWLPPEEAVHYQPVFGGAEALRTWITSS